MDLNRFVRSVVRVCNESGGRGYEGGLRTFDCPLCGDTRERGWLGVSGFGAGCFNPGCPAEPTLPGGAVEWARRVLRLATRAEAWRHLEKHFGGETARSAPSPRGTDFCRMPPHLHDFEPEPPASLLQREFTRFVRRQWGVVGAEDAAVAGFRWCVRGQYAFRVVIPIVMFGHLVGFQARSIRGGFPKYVTSRYGKESDPAAECGRPAAAMLYNIDAVRPGFDVILVEGAGDSLGWRATGSVVPAVGLLGVALTPAKLAMIHAARPSRVVVALDALDPDAQRRALTYVEDLQTWGLEATVGRWVGGKDAGSGAALSVEADWSLGAAVRARLGHQETDGAIT